MQLNQYLSADRGRQSTLCKQIGAHAPDLSRWAKGERPVPAPHCAAIEQATDRQVMRWDLRPDDWHRIWPELIGQAGAPQVKQAA